MDTATTRPNLPAAAQTPEANPPGAPHLLDSQELLRGQNAVAIAHNGSLYRLQATRQGKLILTK
jgi:hemin uptake protein HemP